VGFDKFDGVERSQILPTSIINDGFDTPGFQWEGLGIALLSHVQENGQQQKNCRENKVRIIPPSDRAVAPQKANEERRWCEGC
jgi:hypothetical protein